MDQRLAVLNYLTEHKGKYLNFIAMEPDAREASFKRIITKNPDLVLTCDLLMQPVCISFVLLIRTYGDSKLIWMQTL
jgi:hypothetical protein